MESHTYSLSYSHSSEESAIRTLYLDLLECWNKQEAGEFSDLIAKDGNVIGFDGSQMNGRSEVKSALSEIFKSHPTGLYVAKVREVRFLSPDIAVLRAVAGMVSRSGGDIIPELNSVQTLVASREKGMWYITLFQNTPAAFHGRPDLSGHVTEELRHLLHLSIPLK